MDRVRFGRALGYGARHAAKSLAQAAEAATAPKPGAKASAAGAGAAGAGASSSAAGPAGARPVAQAAARGVEQARSSVAQARKGSRQFGRSVWGPLKKFSSVLWLQVTGTFFVLFAVFMGEGLWKAREQFRAAAAGPIPGKLYVQAVVFVVFAYFGVSSFVRANRRDRR